MHSLDTQSMSKGPEALRLSGRSVIRLRRMRGFAEADVFDYDYTIMRRQKTGHLREGVFIGAKPVNV